MVVLRSKGYPQVGGQSFPEMLEHINEDQFSNQSLLTATVHVSPSRASFSLWMLVFNTLELKLSWCLCLPWRKEINKKTLWYTYVKNTWFAVNGLKHAKPLVWWWKSSVLPARCINANIFLSEYHVQICWRPRHTVTSSMHQGITVFVIWAEHIITNAPVVNQNDQANTPWEHFPFIHFST